MKIYLIDGAKNSFALVSYLEFKDPPKVAEIYQDKAELAQLAQRICTHKDILVDGCVFIFPSVDQDFAWEFFNSDGSDALMCGNASRAVAIWYHQNINKKTKISYFTPSQIVDAEILNSRVVEDVYRGQVRVYLNKAKYVGQESGYEIYDTGVPHLCVYVSEKDLEYFEKNDSNKSCSSFDSVSEKFFNKAKSLRFPSLLNSKGANVTFIWKSLSSEDKGNLNYNVRAMTFERGVENWTQACGTGAIAAAYFVKDILKMEFPINIQMPGGVLEINETDGRTTLSGPAQVIKIVNLDLN